MDGHKLNVLLRGVVQASNMGRGNLRQLLDARGWTEARWRQLGSTLKVDLEREDSAARLQAVEACQHARKLLRQGVRRQEAIEQTLRAMETREAPAQDAGGPDPAIVEHVEPEEDW